MSLYVCVTFLTTEYWKDTKESIIVKMKNGEEIGRTGNDDDEIRLLTLPF